MEVELKRILEEKLNISYWLNLDSQNDFFKKIYSYIQPRIRNKDILNYYFDETIIFLQELDFSQEEIITTLYNSPSFLQSNKQDMFAKFLMLAPLLDKNSFQPLRKSIMIDSPKHLVRSTASIYARMNFLLNKGLEYITKWNVLKMTNKEFEERFHIKNEELMTMYPYDELKISELLEWPGNEEIKETIHSNTNGGGYTTNA